jgi:hypothetical protein
MNGNQFKEGTATHDAFLFFDFARCFFLSFET